MSVNPYAPPKVEPERKRPPYSRVNTDSVLGAILLVAFAAFAMLLANAIQ